MFHIRKASETELADVRNFYYRHIDEMQYSQYKTAWQKGIYPSDSMLSEALSNGELFIGISNGCIVAAMIINHKANPEYKTVQWTIPASDKDVMVIHALGVLPSYSGNGFAKKLLAHAIAYAKSQSQKALRLDVLVGNVPAIRLYTGAGFQQVSTLQMYYVDTGWTQFELYELAL